MLVKTYAAALQSINARTVTIEVSCTPGSYFQLVGLPDTAIKESQDRIISAIQSCGYRYPGRRIVINMSPADLRKEGSAYDLPLAIGILAADEQIPSEPLERLMIMGELSLDGSLQPIRGALPIAIQARSEGYEGLILPKSNAQEAAVVNQLKVYGADNLSEVIAMLCGRQDIMPTEVDTRGEFYRNQRAYPFDFNEVKGQENVKRALEVAAAGGHNLLMVGAPGSGKSMMAKRLPSILPPFSLGESLETTKIYSVAGKLGKDITLMTVRPFRAPHHSISPAALVGGGSNPQPGEISLAHNGVLFLDELPEFSRNVLEVMRQPLEERMVTVARARFSVDYPASFMLIAAMNPCPCGYYNHPTRACECTPQQVQKYLGRVSGPLLDRVDIQVEIFPVPFEKLSDQTMGESSHEICQRVVRAREIQNQRFAQCPEVHCNAQMTPKLMQLYAQPDEAGLARLKVAMERLNLSARAYDRILKVARTIADLAGKERIDQSDIGEAIQYRSLDKASWGTQTAKSPV
ncbi:YifB family Mg chelatase-like AAA ATPase [Porphyromonas sp. COT-290 OH3588]|uniref:YifB family Mg chelatase-like AAA ATPase n=1 Tax=Porphyromonas sp. COT-290 OH3588 TaxID=1515617 RepID=UPI00052B690D|nr:YifB family Mg chelatase-like AAA ATPase [Porphyromonas sp. COT-290 OH3588]KGN97412.1 magnesium chelatase [Porphyromonas sp. COT-290 OH3588]